MKSILIITFSIIVFSPFILPALVYGQPYTDPNLYNQVRFQAPNQNSNTGVVPCKDDCDWKYLIKLGQNLIEYLVIIAGSLAAISFAYAGWLYMTSAGDSGKVSKAKELFTKVAIGLVLVLCAWLIVHMIVKILGVDQGYSLIKTS